MQYIAKMGQIQSQMQWIITYFSFKFSLCTYSHAHDWCEYHSAFSAVYDLMVKLRKWNHQIDLSGILMCWREWNNVQTCYSFTDWITASFSLVAVVSSCAMCCVCDSGILVVLLILSALLTSVALLLFYDFEQPCDKAVLNSTVRIYLQLFQISYLCIYLKKCLW